MQVRKAEVHSISLSEGTVYGKRYFTAEPNFGADTHTWFALEWDDMVKWCVDTYGAGPRSGIHEPNGRWYTNNAKFWFREENDRDWFILKWR